MDMEKFPLLAEEWKHLFLINQFGIEEIQTKLRILNEEYEFLHDYKMCIRDSGMPVWELVGRLGICRVRFARPFQHGPKSIYILGIAGQLVGHSQGGGKILHAPRHHQQPLSLREQDVYKRQGLIL